MKKLIPGLLGVLLLASCSKSDPNNVGNNIDPQNATAISKAITVWHGSRVAGTPPPPSNNGSGPLLDPMFNNLSIKAIAGRYAMIQPLVAGGNVKGYYVQVQGSSEYFKVDYTRPRTGGRSATSQPGQRTLPMQRFMGVDSTGNGAADSSIVIALPANVQPGQFCVSYCAFDSLGNVSNVISNCITIASFGGDASTGYLAGTWRATGYKDSSGSWVPVVGVDTTRSLLTCVNGQLQSYCPNGGCTFTEYITSLAGTEKYNLTFGSSGSLSDEIRYVFKDIDLSAPGCTTPTYFDNSVHYLDYGAWSYNSGTQKLTLIFDFSNQGSSNGQVVEEFRLIKVGDNVIELKNETYGISYRFQKS